MSKSLASEVIKEELRRWMISFNQNKTVFDTFEALKSSLPNNNQFWEIYSRKEEEAWIGDKGLKQRYSRYSKATGRSHDVAYFCPRCEKIVANAPKMEILSYSDVKYECENCTAVFVRNYD